MVSKVLDKGGSSNLYYLQGPGMLHGSGDVCQVLKEKRVFGSVFVYVLCGHVCYQENDVEHLGSSSS